MKFNRLIPELTVIDLDKSIEFYTNVLGFKVEYQRNENKFVFISFKGAQLMLEEGKPAKSEQMNFQIETDDVDALYMSLKKRGYPIHTEMREAWYRMGDKLTGNREFIVADPDSYLLRFAKDLGTKPF